ncbi:MAG: cytochrome o ubiquinol oxidase subunit I, partial [Pseudomonadota bacterium]
MATPGEYGGTAGAEVAHWFWGKLTWEIFPFYDPIILTTAIGAAFGGALVVYLITRNNLWGYLWYEWLTSVDHKKIGIMYMILALVMFVRGFADALLMRGQQALASMGYDGYLNAHHYDQVFTA